MFRNHPHFAHLDPETVIWRYMDISKFKHLVQYSALYFRRADLLMQMDSMEGALTNRMEEFVRQALFTLRFVKSLKAEGVVTLGKKTQIQGRPALEIRDEIRQRFRGHYQYLLQRTYINCWHINPQENTLMWGQYIPSRYGVAIRSTVGKLRDALAETDAEVYGVPVGYVDHFTDPLRPEMLPGGMSQIVFDMLAKKRKPFSGEQEFRLVTDTLTHDEKWAPNWVGSHLDMDAKNDADSTTVGLSLDTLIESVFLYPQSGPQLRTDVMSILEGTDLIGRVKPSILD